MSSNIESFLEVMFKKNFKSITKEDFASVESLIIKDIKDLDFIENFPNLKTVNFEKCKIDSESISKLTMLKKMEFYKCYIDIPKLKNPYENLKTLIFNNCFCENMNFLQNTKNLFDLELINPYNDFELDISLISKNTTLEILCIEGVIVENEVILNQFSNLRILSLLNSSITSVEFLESLSDLKELYIDKKWMEDKYIIGYQKQLKVRNNINNLLCDN